MKNQFKKSDHTTNSIFQELTSTDIDYLLSKSNHVKYPKDSIIFEQGEPGDTMFLIEEGQVCLELITSDGKTLTLAFLGKNEFFGEMAVMDNAGRSCRASAATILSLAAISRENFRTLLLQKPDIALKIIAILCRRLRLTDYRLEGMAHGRVKERFIKMLAEPSGDNRKIQIMKTHQQLATELGTTRETITRVIRELRAEGWVIYNKAQLGQPN